MTELAFKKLRLRGVGDRRKGEKEITRLRAEIMDLRVRYLTSLPKGVMRHEGTRAAMSRLRCR